VGPGPAGQVYAGEIEKADLQSIRLLMQGAATHSERGLRLVRCPTVEPESASGAGESWQKISFKQDKSDWNVEWKKERQACLGDGSSDVPVQVNEIKARLQRLAEKYYPKPFPNMCLDAGLSLRSLDDEMRGCDRDSDCELIDSEYQPLDPFREEVVVLDDCSHLPPIGVANLFKVATHQRELVLARAVAAQICGNDPVRPGCFQPKLHPSAQVSAICDSGMCRVVSR
jgi:hypothetical protein